MSIVNTIFAGLNDICFLIIISSQLLKLLSAVGTRKVKLN